MDKRIITVKMAEQKVASSPDVLITYGLGSCVGVTIYDKDKKIGGLAHIMLPSGPSNRDIANRSKYADTAIIDMLKDLLDKGGSIMKFEAKVFGGAKMFSVSSNNDMMDIGARNVQSVIKLLGNQGVQISARDTGNNYGRTIEFDLETGLVKVSSVSMGEKVI